MSRAEIQVLIDEMGAFAAAAFVFETDQEERLTSAQVFVTMHLASQYEFVTKEA